MTGPEIQVANYHGKTCDRFSPEGCQTVAGGRSASGDLRYASEADLTLKGSQKAVVQTKGLAPLQGAENFFTLTGGIAVLLRATAQPPATVWHAFSVQRFLSSARTLSHVIPVSGRRRSCSARLSNSAICSEVKSSLNSRRG